MPDSSSSEDEEELKRLQAVSVTGQDIAAAAVIPSRKKRKRRADDVANGGTNGTGIVEDKLWKALAQRLDGDLECQLATPPDAATHSPAEQDSEPAQDGDTFRLFRRAQPGVQAQLPATTAAANGVLSPATQAAQPAGGAPTLTRKQRAKLVAKERRLERKAAKREAAAAQNAPRPLPPPPPAPVDKIAEALRAGADAAHYVSVEIGEAGAGGTAGAAAASGTAAVATQNGGAAAGLTDRERRKQKRIAKRERRLPAKLEAQQKRKAVKADRHRKKYAIKQQRKAAKARIAASADAAGAAAGGAAGGGAASSHSNAGGTVAHVGSGAPSPQAMKKGGKGNKGGKAKGKGKRQQVGVKRGKFSKAKVKQRLRTRKGQNQAAAKT